MAGWSCGNGCGCDEKLVGKIPMATRMKPDNWDNIPRNVKLAYILYPSQAPAWAQEEIRRRAANEGKQAPSGIPDRQQMPKAPGSAPRVIPGFHRVKPQTVRR